jgi:hypothetical protein
MVAQYLSEEAGTRLLYGREEHLEDYCNILDSFLLKIVAQMQTQAYMIVTGDESKSQYGPKMEMVNLKFVTRLKVYGKINIPVTMVIEGDSGRHHQHQLMEETVTSGNINGVVPVFIKYPFVSQSGAEPGFPDTAQVMQMHSIGKLLIHSQKYKVIGHCNFIP